MSSLTTASRAAAALALSACVTLGVAFAGSPRPASGAAVGGPRFAKRGIASAKYLARTPAKLAAIGAAWSYDWSATPPPPGRGPEWVPMVWGAGSVTLGSLSVLRAAHRTGRARYLLGFNEPDSGAQSNMTPEQAAALWPALQRTGLTLGSPAPAVPADGWLERFMTLVARRHLRVAFIALHFYQDFTNPSAVPALRRQLTALHHRYHRPLWITEIGAIDLRSWHEPMHATPTTAAATGYMRRLFAMLDGLPFVERYAWFTDSCRDQTDCRYGSLFDAGGRLTPAGGAFESAP